MEEGEIRAELRRVEQRFIDSKETHELESKLLKDQFLEYKEMVRAKHFEMNEVRKQINEERGQFALRQAVDDKVSAIEARVGRMENANSGMTGRYLGLGMGLTVLMVLIDMALRLWPKAQ